MLGLTLTRQRRQVAPVGSKLANDHRIAFIHEVGLHLLQLCLHVGLLAPGGIMCGTAQVVALSPIIEDLTPRLVFLHAPELPRVIVVYFNSQLAFGDVCRHLIGHEVTRVLNIG